MAWSPEIGNEVDNTASQPVSRLGSETDLVFLDLRPRGRVK